MLETETRESRQGERIEADHLLPIQPDERVRGASRVQRQPNHVATFADAGCGAPKIITVQRAKVLPSPQEGVKGYVARDVRKTNHLIMFIEIKGQNSLVAARSAEVAEVGHCAFLPEQCVKSRNIFRGIRVEGRARSRRANHIAVIVCPEGDSVRVTRECTEFPDLAFPPGDRLELVERLARRAARVGGCVLRSPGHFA